eukprot:TRINITY_DN67636_c0_g1_i1.p1 TRINITY_DN67636_c0_g1~~TRINITY_DN67636_c0_g1_i1.p1  ORF type:complete len:682 (+),score=76.06 TRINITY_DN67636_c0_g1_i1:1029-3074(+)
MKQSNRDLDSKRRNLPIWQAREEIIRTVRDNQVTVLVGETGSGKTTQLPQFLLDDGYTSIACTQPRKIAAISVSQRVAEEMGCLWGTRVGYVVRFDSNCSDGTCLRYMTDGILLQECVKDTNFNHYQVVVIDEVHERTHASDILLGLLKACLPRRPALKVVLMSATMNSVKFSSFFGDVPILSVPGRQYPVELLHLTQAVPDYFEYMLQTVRHIVLFEPYGHILVFLTGEEAIEEACSQMRRWDEGRNALWVLPLYAGLNPRDQRQVFDQPKAGVTKVIFATNIAETSITIDGVRYVVDCGYSKQKVFLPRARVEALFEQPISKASAMQRAGRAGRTGPGRCYRLYDIEAFRDLVPETPPEILRTNPTQVILQLAKLGVANVTHFDFIDPPPAETMIRALETLQLIGALDQQARLTHLGSQMSLFPLDPVLARTLVTASKFECTRQIATIIAMLSVPNLFFRRGATDEGAEERATRHFKHRDGDHLTLLKTYNFFVASCSGGDVNAELSQRVLRGGCRETREFCRKHSLNEGAMLQAANVRHQLLNVLQAAKLPVTGIPEGTYDTSPFSESVRKALAYGLISQLAYHAEVDSWGSFATVTESTTFRLHTSCCLKPDKKGNDEWVVYHEAVVLQKSYLRTCSRVEERWLLENWQPEFWERISPKDGSTLAKKIKDLQLRAKR